VLEITIEVLEEVGGDVVVILEEETTGFCTILMLFELPELSVQL